MTASAVAFVAPISLSSVLAWVTVFLIQLYALGYAFRCGQIDQMNGGGQGYAWAAFIFSALSIFFAHSLGAA